MFIRSLFGLKHLYLAEEGGDLGNPGGAPATQEPAPATTTQDTDWRAGLGDELSKDEAFKDFKDLPSLAKNYKDLQSHLGNSIRIPSQEADDAQWGEFRNKLHTKVPGLLALPKEGDEEGLKNFNKALGVPDAPDAYTYTKDENDGISDERLNQLRALAHKNGLTAKQFDGMLTEIASADMAEMQAIQDGLKSSHEELYKEWGVAFKDRVDGIAQFLERSGAPEELLQHAKDNNLGGKTLRWLHSLTQAISGEGGNIELQGKTTSQGGRLDPTEAMQRADELFTQIMALPQGDARYDALVKKRFEYIKMANPGASTDINQLRANVSFED